MPHTLTTLALVALVATATWTDLRTRRIPNVLTVGGIVVGLALRFMSGAEAAIAGGFGLLLAVLFAMPFVFLGGLGGGDAKLLAAVGAFVGPAALPVVLAVTAVTGGTIALVAVLRAHLLPDTLRHCRLLIQAAAARISGGSPAGDLRTLDTPGAFAVPYGPAIAVGALAGWFA